MPLLRRPFAAAVLLAVVWPCLSLLAGSGADNPLEPMDPADPSTSTSPTASATPASTPAATAVAVNYSGTIRRTPAGGSAPVNGSLRVTISPLGKVTGWISWYDSSRPVKITGKQDVDTKQGYFVVRDANGARVPAAPRLPFRISKKNRLVGNGLLASGETSRYRLDREPTDTGDDSDGGATLTLGAVDTYTGTSTATINTGALLNNPGGGSSVVATFPSGSVTGVSSTNIGTGTLTLAGVTTVAISPGTGVTLPAISSDGNLYLGHSLLLLGPVTTTTGTDGSITYTGTYTSGSPGTVIVLGTGNGG